MSELQPAVSVPTIGWVAARALECGRTSDTALLHLLAPVDVAVGLQLLTSGGTVSFRGRSAHLDVGAERARQLRDFVERCTEPGDRFLPADARGGDLVKIVRSGACFMLAGASELFGGPRVAVTADIAAPDLLAWARRQVAARRLPTGVRHVPFDGVEVAGGRARCVLRPTDSHRETVNRTTLRAQQARFIAHSTPGVTSGGRLASG